MKPPRNSPQPGAALRRPAPSLSGNPVVVDAPAGHGPCPLVIQSRAEGLLLSAWSAGRRTELEALATERGAVLLRGFSVQGAEDFETCVENIAGGALEYRFRASPRTEVGRNVYTATDYPAEQSIFPHNEHSYSPLCPRYLIFYGETPAEQGGETPLGDAREITRRIDPSVKERFLRRGVLYVRNYGAGFGLPWPTVFQTDDRAEVERYCAGLGIEWEWRSGDRLRTRQTGPAMIRHPATAEQVWFNHATFFHVTTLPAPLRDALTAEFSAGDLPTQTYYGDGAPIEADVLEHLRAVYQGALTQFGWRRNDVLLVDNILAVHGRTSFRGFRRILVAMAQSFKPRDFAVIPEPSS
ncbi:TauD/TfdA family dioxygenase [Methylocapsa palsarum]|uniref:Taurine dioxygenase, alpha-ketoglutarate-dependent n=1 Tax=Methylocapsa palsarum TaxID=1612308 RepID=A0A1I4ANZ7_9HYPH|nr:TauD/TfdA family dioxygenase [Methylocapsa palsarum]SFK58242.1 Taurine dioxygenase, alpha-ketoglutarate-dependent [Methylocapsa palsarum]